MGKFEKTNVMRILDQAKIPYAHYLYPHRDGEAVDGVTPNCSASLRSGCSRRW